jgi:hypothetical protein
LIELREGVSNPHQEQFSLLFRGPAEPLLPQHIYPVEHDQLALLRRKKIEENRE